MKNVRRSLLTSSVSLLLCFVMLIGTTFAWFTDVATSANNIIKTGNLDVSMYWNTDNGTEWKNAEGINAEPIFDYHNWEPGYTEVRYIKVKNEGDLAFQYRMYIDPTGVVGELADVIDVYYDVVTDNNGFAVPVSFSNMGSLQRLGTLRNVISEDISIPGGVLLPAGETENGCYSGEVVICVAFHMQESANNHYQGESIGDSFGITLHATQYSYEKDSFGTEYDSDAKWPEKPVNLYATKNINGTPLVYGELANEVAINGDKISATLPEGVKIADNATTLNLTVESTETDANLSLGEDASARGFDVHISGIAADNTQPMIVNLGAVLPAGIAATELKLYHTENGTPVQMTRVNSTADFARHNHYVYNEATGEVTIYVASFSTFSMVKASVDAWDGEAVATEFASGTGTEADPYIINTAAQLVYFRNQVDAGVTYKGEFVKLGNDIDLNNINFNPIGYGYTYGKESNTAFMGTFDGGNHTIYNLYQNGWALGDSYNTAGGGLFASIENATITNLVVSGADIKFECVDMGIVVGYAQGNCHFENIVVTNSKIANYNRATGAVVGEVCYGSYGTDTTKGYSHTFTNIVVDSNVVVSSLWGSFDTLIGGVIGGKWGDATVKMENVITAAELDVYSDVTAAYQWYAYRRCGMLIGHTEQNSPKSALNAAAPFLTCDNVKVYYGDWVNYNYYEFAEQDSPTGRNYPWVRAEASPVGNNGAFSNPRYGVPTFNDKKVTEMTDEEFKAAASNSTPIIFNQLYGGGQGVYGCAEHDGVTTNSKSSKTIYVRNNAGWTNLKLQYWFANGDDTWTTIIDGIDMSTMLVEENVYKIQLPTAVSAFKIVADGSNSSGEIALSTLENDDHYCLGNSHDYSTTTVTNPTCEDKGYTTHTCKCGDAYKTDYTNALGHNWKTNPYTCSECGLAAETKTIYFQNNWQWSKVTVYYWFVDSSGKWFIEEFPGVSMKKCSNDGTYDIYSIEIPAHAYGFIFSNGTKVDEAGHKQSVDIKVADIDSGTVFWMVWDGDDNNGSDFVGSNQYANGNFKTHDIYIVGDMNGWSTSNIDNKYHLTPSADGKTWTITMTFDETTEIKLYNALIYDGNGWINEKNSTKNISLTSGEYIITYNTANNNFTVKEVIYFNANNNGVNWTSDKAWFAAWVWGSSEADAWYKFVLVSGSTYKIEIPYDATGMKIVRMSNVSTDPSWDKANGAQKGYWNQTGNITIPTNGNNLFTISKWDDQTSGWSKKQ